MLKSSGISPIASLQMTCGSCLYHSGVALYSKPCHELGVEDYALAPKCFRPNVHMLVQQVDGDFIAQLGRKCSHLPSDALRLLAYTLSGIAAIQESGFKFGQPVYFSLGGDYISHYFKGVLVALQDDVATISATLNKAKSPTLIMAPVDSILTKSQWRVKLAKLANLGRLKSDVTVKTKQCLAEILTYEGTLSDDWLAEVQRNQQLDEIYEPPTIDSAPDALIAAFRKDKEKKGMAVGKNKRRTKPAKIGFDLQTKIVGGAETVEIDTETGFGEDV